jgi:hypothetical protein
MEPRDRFQLINSARLCSPAGRYDNPSYSVPSPLRLFKNSSSGTSSEIDTQLKGTESRFSNIFPQIFCAGRPKGNPRLLGSSCHRRSLCRQVQILSTALCVPCLCCIMKTLITHCVLALPSLKLRACKNLTQSFP